MKKICRNCGHDNDDKRIFCSSCGTLLTNFNIFYHTRVESAYENRDDIEISDDEEGYDVSPDFDDDETDKDDVE